MVFVGEDLDVQIEKFLIMVLGTWGCQDYVVTQQPFSAWSGHYAQTMLRKHVDFGHANLQLLILD